MGWIWGCRAVGCETAPFGEREGYHQFGGWRPKWNGRLPENEQLIRHPSTSKPLQGLELPVLPLCPPTPRPTPRQGHAFSFDATEALSHAAACRRRGAIHARGGKGGGWVGVLEVFLGFKGSKPRAKCFFGRLSQYWPAKGQSPTQVSRLGALGDALSATSTTCSSMTGVVLLAVARVGEGVWGERRLLCQT